MLSAYIAALCIVAAIVWAIYMMISERTTRVESDFQEAAQLLNGTCSEEPSSGWGKGSVLKCSSKGHEFTVVLTKRRKSAGLSINVPVKNCRLQFAAAPKTFVRSMDRLSDDCRFSHPVEVDLRSRTLYVIGDDKEGFAQRVRDDRRLADAVYYLAFESGQDGLSVRNGVLSTSTLFKAKYSRPESLRQIITELSAVAETLDKAEA